MISLGERSYRLSQGVPQLFCVRIAQIPVTGNTKKRTSTNAVLVTGVVAFLQEFISSTNENVLSKHMRTKLDRIRRKTRVVFFETCGHP